MKRLLTLLAALALLGATATPAMASAPESPHTPRMGVVPGNTTATEEVFAADGTLVSSTTYGSDTAGELLGGTAAGGISILSSGSGGSSSASGCTRVTVNNEYETTLGFTAFWFHTWTNWCWNRSTEVVSGVTHGWTISDVDSTFNWQGIINSEFLFYDYSTNDGHPLSAYKNYQQGRFEDCLFSFGCIGSVYPANTLRSYYNGTWAWETDD